MHIGEEFVWIGGKGTVIDSSLLGMGMGTGMDDSLLRAGTASSPCPYLR
jgi:hypothetical protein